MITQTTRIDGLGKDLLKEVWADGIVSDLTAHRGCPWGNVETTNSRSESPCRPLSSGSPVNVALMNSLTDLPRSVPSVKSSIPAFLSFARLFRREFLLFRTLPRFWPPGSTMWSRAAATSGCCGRGCRIQIRLGLVPHPVIVWLDPVDDILRRY